MDAKTTEAIALLQSLIALPSPSRGEEQTADRLFAFLAEHGAAPERLYNNIIARSTTFDPARPTLLLNSHHDTVRPVDSYTRDPYAPTIEGDKLYGLGSNDAGASVVTLAQTFLTLRDRPLPVNLLLALTAEEECMGEHGIRALLPTLGHIDCALVGEPTSMQAATGERGLVVLDCQAHGISGHAARGEGVNALYIALDDIAQLRTLHFERESALLGAIGIAVTQIEAGTQHNVVPDRCHFVVDIRTTDAYTNEQTIELVRRALHAELTPRSTHIRAVALDDNDPLVRAARGIGRSTFVSPTTSDRTLMPFPSLKMGPGQSARSHAADEYVLLSEIAEGLTIYEQFIEQLIEENGWKTLG
ncbi:MAG: M20 family metallo-hydrolase [Alistipes sp.]